MPDRDILKFARKAIEQQFSSPTELNEEALLNAHPNWSDEQATFVTLTLNGKLRGCIGSIVAHRPLLEDLLHNAQAAAFSDPRFMPLSEEEFEQVHIEVSLLSKPKEVTYSSAEELKKIIRPNIDGVIIIENGKQATFLPQVWETLPTFEQFFSHLGQKAGIRSDVFKGHPTVFTYQVKAIEE